MLGHERLGDVRWGDHEVCAEDYADLCRAADAYEEVQRGPLELVRLPRPERSLPARLGLRLLPVEASR